MPNPTETSTKQAETRERGERAEQAAIVAGLQTVLEPDEQLLAFARGKIAGGWRGKFAVGLEAFFAPDVNVGLTERRFVLQHIHATNKTPSEILPHFFALTDISNITFGDIETFGGDPAGRLVMRLQDEQHFRVRLAGKQNCEDARALADVFRSLTTARRKSGMSPTQSACPNCQHILDQPFRFCPYCGTSLQHSSPPPPPDFDGGTAGGSPDSDAPDGGSPVGFAPPEPPSAPPAPASSPSDFSADSTTDAAPETDAAIAMPPRDFAAPVAAPPDFTAPVAAPPDVPEPIIIPPDLEEPVMAPPPHHTNGTAQYEPPIGYHESPVEDFALPVSPIERTTADSHSMPFTPQPVAAAEAIAPNTAEDEFVIGAEEILPPAAPPIPPLHSLPPIEEMNAATPATTAFWREFARISGVATPEVLAQSAPPKSESSAAHDTRTETDKE